MAFRASRKASTKTDSTPTSPKAPLDVPTADAVTSSGSISVEDLVGGPVTDKEQTTNNKPASLASRSGPAGGQPTTEDTDLKKDINDHPVSAPPVVGRDPSMGQPSSGYRPRYSQSPQSSQSFGYRRGGGGYRRDPGSSYGNGDRRSSGGYSNDNVYTPDINVPTETVRGVLDTMPEGHGFLRPKYTPSDRDIYISQSQIRRFLLRNGDMVQGQARQPKDNERFWGLLKVETVNEQSAEGIGTRPKFEDLTPVYPNKQVLLETEKLPLSTRMIDLVAPIGFGQRGLVVSPPKAGKTTILKEIAAGIAANYPNVHLMAALIGERPEEVTDISRNVKGEVFASNFDESPQEQTRIAEVALDRAKRLVEMGHDVIILLDSITRLARAYNLVVNPSGRTLSGGFDPAALYPAKRFLGAARCVEGRTLVTGDQTPREESGQAPEKDKKTETMQNAKSITGGGSLTVIGTALIDTGSRMDDLIYEEFKGTGNMELTLSRILQERRVFPAIDVGKSGTRHDELLLGEEAMKKVTTLRHMLSLLSDEERTLMLIDRLSKTNNNTEFLESLAKG